MEFVKHSKRAVLYWYRYATMPRREGREENVILNSKIPPRISAK